MSKVVEMKSTQRTRRGRYAGFSISTVWRMLGTKRLTYRQVQFALTNWYRNPDRKNDLEALARFIQAAMNKLGKPANWSRLEKENAALKAEVLKLRARIAAFETTKEMLPVLQIVDRMEAKYRRAMQAKRRKR